MDKYSDKHALFVSDEEMKEFVIDNMKDISLYLSRYRNHIFFVSSIGSVCAYSKKYFFKNKEKILKNLLIEQNLFSENNN